LIEVRELGEGLESGPYLEGAKERGPTVELGGKKQSSIRDAIHTVGRSNQTIDGGDEHWGLGENHN